MTRRCKCGCGHELPPASKCADIIEKKGFASVEHLVKHTRAKDAKRREKAYKARTTELKAANRDNDRGHWLKQAQAAFNAFIRVRDEKDTCISCGRHHDGQYHAGHYRTVGAHPELRFDELNCHKQCSVCNNHLSGNLLEYRISLIKKIGQGTVEILEGPHKPKKYSVDDLKQIAKTYKQKKKDLEE